MGGNTCKLGVSSTISFFLKYPNNPFKIKFICPQFYFIFLKFCLSNLKLYFRHCIRIQDDMIVNSYINFMKINQKLVHGNKICSKGGHCIKRELSRLAWGLPPPVFLLIFICTSQSLPPRSTEFIVMVADHGT